MVSTANDTLVVGCDANRATTGDSADNIDALIRRKPNASRYSISDGWEAPSLIKPLEMRDYSNKYGYAPASSSVIDGAIIEDSVRHRLMIVIDLWAWNGGVFEHLNVSPDGSVNGGRPRKFPLGDGFATVAGRDMLLLSTHNVTGDADGLRGNINLNIDRSQFDLVADLDGPRDKHGRIRIYELIGIPRPYTTAGVDDSNLALGRQSRYSLDDNFNLFEAGIPLYVFQHGSARITPMRVFYKDSILQVFNTNHIVEIYSYDDGRTWNMGKLVTRQFRPVDSRYTLVAPGRSIQIRAGEHAGRIVVPTYMMLPAGVSCTTVYTDDGRKTWQRGIPMPATIDLHESAIIEILPGVLRSFNRHSASSGGKVLTAESVDGGHSWSTLTSAFGDDDQGVACQVSALMLKQTIASPTTGEQLPALIVVSADDRRRRHGIAHVAVIHRSSRTSGPRSKLEWVSHTDITSPQTLFAYSSIAQLSDGRVLVLFESSPTDSWADGLQRMYLQELAS
ncbi:exo-alpha-sialidase [Cutibacterium acnes]|uniref:exo-alpha-sialidase n=1 Tax=Cutibacterium acnes TaxID=1747 RepID=UPI0012E1D66A|nr:sialidase family protein [Cutibacterium acnes]MUT17523.1 exo-alpha-sialidase [Cutibacterium acnes]